LKAGRTVGIFPEGVISPEEGGLARVHTGAARLALSTGVPVIPIGIALDKNCITRIKTIVDGQVEVGTWYFHGAYAMTVGEPMFFEGDPNNHAFVHEVTGQIAMRIAEFTQESAQRLAVQGVSVRDKWW
jgi:1-acyl-sn-glycerol-3-phosphate acyltransferase